MLALSVMTLALGLLVYLTDRTLSRSAWIPNDLALSVGPVFGVAGGWLPSFAHGLGFSLLTAAWLPSRGLAPYGGCLLWAIVDTAMEAGQHPALRTGLARSIQDAFGASPLPTTVARYFSRGTFDLADVGAVVLGAAAAAVLLRLLRPPLEKCS